MRARLPGRLEIIHFPASFNGRQRFIRIGCSPGLSLKAARARAGELRWIVDDGRDPAAREDRGRQIIPPVEDLMQYIAENLVTKV